MKGSRLPCVLQGCAALRHQQAGLNHIWFGGARIGLTSCGAAEYLTTVVSFEDDTCNLRFVRCVVFIILEKGLMGFDTPFNRQLPRCHKLPQLARVSDPLGCRGRS